MKYFGTDGIRGKARDLITKELSYKVGFSMQLLESKLVIIGRDTRESGVYISKAIQKGILDAGLDVLYLDVVPTPLLAYYSIMFKCHGIMITASHNPYIDNGIKIFNQGIKTTKEAEEKIEAVIDGLNVLEKQPLGKELPYESALHKYDVLFNDVFTKSHLNIVFDLANGATVKSAKHIFSQILDNPIFIGDRPNGININYRVGSTHINSLAKVVVDQQFDVGFSFDGDGDRVLAVDRFGRVVDGDLLIYIIAIYLKEKNLLRNNTVVLTKMSNIGIINALAEQGIKVVQTDVGDKYVVKALHDLDAVLGGEASGHIINRNLFVSGDGVLNAAYLIKIMTEYNKTLDQLIDHVEIYPDTLVNLDHVDKTLATHESVLKLVEDITTKLGASGKVLVRASGTENLIRVSASAKTQEEVDEIIKTIVQQIKSLNEREG